jgi:hypothetical protein
MSRATTGFAVALLGLGAVYAGVMGGFALGFRRVRRAEVAGPTGGGLPPVALPTNGTATNGTTVNGTPSSALPFVSVIVPARDEAAAISRCLRSILANDYPADRFEVIVVDDLSEDETPERVADLMRQVNRHPVPAGIEEAAGGSPPPLAPSPEGERLRLLRMPENLERAQAHKKRAITKGIAHARGEIILSTDADCAVRKGWIRAMAGRFDAETALVSGPVLYPVGHSPVRHVQALEFLGLVAVGAGAIGIGRPNLCNGANVAYRKAVFDALGGFAGIDHLTSGDDELLMQKIAYETSWRVRFCPDREATVLTEGAPTLRAFFEQRRRWASKGTHYPDLTLRATVGAIYVFYVALLAGALALPWAPRLAKPLAGALALKALPEAALLGPACRHFGRGRLMGYFPLAQLAQIPYVVAIGAAGALGGYTWKGRRIAR